jgi:acyl-CoA hydrolase
MTEIVMPGDANHLGTCFGGRIMSWIDMVAAIAANRLVGSVVTASVDSIEFKRPIKVGDVVTLKARVNRVWNSSMEVGVKITVQSPVPGIIRGQMPAEDTVYTQFGSPEQACRAYLTFVAVDDQGKRRSVLDLLKNNPIMERHAHDDIRRAEEADKRRETRLANKKGV